ncbi:MAG: hypothetical protein DRN81_01325 [Thermoproteota archaeon]|nr:MAG: hypothetical protein DRN81_01325 [Candidatus Korarchaeota archaeon]
MKTKVFAYKGIIGIESSLDAEGLINNPREKGQLGFSLKAESVEFSQGAIDILLKIEKSSDAIGDVDIFMSNNDGVVFSWIGGPRRAIHPGKAEGSNVYDPTLISATDNVDVPEDFKQYVDGYFDSLKKHSDSE